jgi:hypothetical protein
MARQVTVWKSEDGKTHETEVEALRADVEYWKLKAKAVKTIKLIDEEHNYSGPGGGRSNSHP